MKMFFKRVGAYLIDWVIITCLVSLLSYLPILNPNRAAYTEKYRELATAAERYTNEEISIDDYTQAAIPIEYDLQRLNIYYIIIDLVCVLSYFGVFQYYFEGQTIGKKILKIKIVNKDGTKMNLLSSMIRAVVLNNSLITIALQIIVFVMSRENYYTIYNNVNLIGSIILYITLFMVLVRTDGRGLHDFVAGTKVIAIDTPTEEKENVIEIESVTEPKPKEKKKATKTSKTKTKEKTVKKE